MRKRKRKRSRGRLLALLLAAVLSAGSLSPTVCAGEERGVEFQESEETPENEAPVPESEEESNESGGLSDQEPGEMPDTSEESPEDSGPGDLEMPAFPEKEEKTESEGMEDDAGEGSSDEELSDEKSSDEEPSGEELSDGEPSDEETSDGELTDAEMEGNKESEVSGVGAEEKSGNQEKESLPDVSEEDACSCGCEETDELLHGWDCPVFQKKLLELCDCGEKSGDLVKHTYDCAGGLAALEKLCGDECGAYREQAAAHRCTVQERLRAALCSCESSSEDFSEHGEDCAYYQYMLGSANELYGTMPAAISEKQSGTRISSSSVSDWTCNEGAYSSKYRGVLFRPGISSLSTWTDSGANVTTWTNTTGEECISMHPNDDASSTKNHFGALYSKVVYDGSKWYDMKITVLTYSNSAKASDGSAVTIRPGIKFSKSRIAFYTNQKVGGMRVKVEFLESGTNVGANLNIRFQWWDIDDSQRFGFSAENASGVSYAAIDHKYYRSADTVVNRSYETVLGAQMEVLTGPLAQHPDDTDQKTQVVFELSNCKGYFMSFGPEDNIGDIYHQYVYTKDYYIQMESAMQRGRNTVTVDHNGDGAADTLHTINDLLVVTDASGLIETPAPAKEVSGTGSSWSTSNTLSSAISEYFYRIVQEVPWQDEGYRYNAFTLSDTLPAGVDYRSLVSIVDEGGRDKSSLFNVSAADDVFTAAAKNPSDSDFAGHWYTFTFKVKMNPSELTPSYSGSTATYTIRNAAGVTIRNSGSAGRTTKNTNTVTTTAVVSAPAVPAPTKQVSNDGNSWGTSNLLSSINGDYYYRVIQSVPAVEYAYRFSSFQIRDTLPEGTDYVSMVSIRDETGADRSGLFTLTEGDLLVILAKNPEAEDFAGHQYTFTFKVKMNPEELIPVFSGSTATCQVQNKASAITKNMGLTWDTKESNTVTTTALINREDPESPKKGIGKDEYLTEYVMGSISEEVIFSVFQKIPSYDAVWEPYTVTMTDTLEDCLEYVDCEVSLDGTELSEGWNVTADGQTITVSGENDGAYDGKTLRFDIACRIKEGYDLSAFQRVEDGNLTAVMPNQAKVKFSWQDSRITDIEKETNLVSLNLVLSVRLTLTKEIDMADIVWAHGNPTFTFQVKGTELSGKTHIWYETVEFTEECEGDGSRLALTAELLVPVGKYRVTELKTMRYTVEDICDIIGGIRDGSDGVYFDLSAGNGGAATFYNVKTTDEGLSHTAFVRNIMKEE